MTSPDLRSLDPRLTNGDPWAAALLAYWHLRAGDVDRAFERIDTLAHGPSFDEQALFLWTSSEAASASDRGADRLARDRVRLDAVVERLGREFLDLGPNWIDIGVPGTYTTRLALTWGALSSYRNVTNHPAAAVLLPRVKEAFFRDFLAGGRLKSRRGGEALFSDIVLCSVPFGLMDAGNQIMVESVSALEVRQFRGGYAFSADTAYFGGAPRPDLDALMAWYYSERGEGPRAKLLLAPWESVLAGSADGLLPAADGTRALDLAQWAHTAPQPNRSVRAVILYHLARQNLARTEGAPGSGTVVLHEPQGHGSRYHPQDRFRHPYLPVAGQSVVVRAVVRPYSAETRASLVVEGASGSGPLVHVGLDGAEGCFEGTLTGLEADRGVRYRFEAVSPAGSSVTPWFEFAPGRTEAVVAVEPGDQGRVVLVTESGARVSTVVEAASGSGARVVWAGGDFSLVCGDRVLVQGWNRFGQSPLSVDLDAQGGAQRLRLGLDVRPDEEFYGAGERFSSLGYRGSRLDCWVFNQYRDQGLKTYIPLPFWQSTGGWGLRVLSPGYSETGFCDRVDGLVEVEADVDGATGGFRFYAGQSWDIVRGYLAETGMPSLPPRWTFGPWMSSNNWDNQALTLEQARLTKELGLPATVLVLEQWSDEATFYVFNDAVYDRRPGTEAFALKDFRFPADGRWPDPRAMVTELHRQGLKVILWQAPVMKYMDGLPHAQRDADEAAMIEQGWGLKHSDGRPYRIPDFEWFKRSLVPDFSNAEAADWWLSKRRYLFDEVGIDGIKTDGGEGVYGRDVTDSQGRTGDVLRNRYPVEYIGAFHRFVQERTGANGVTFSRAGFEGAQTMPAHWAGDERSTFESFRNSVRAGLTAGLSGLPFWGWDLGGFNGEVPDAELYLRGAGMAAFCPLMQYHAESKGEKNRDRTPWNIAERSGDPRVIPAYRKFAQARMNLLPYLWAEAQHTAATGEALMRALWTEVPDDPAYRPIDDEYLLGRNLLVAPVVHQGQTQRTVVFPPGRWVPLFGGAAVDGPSVRLVEAPLDEVPVWFRSGAAVALNLPENGAFPGDVGNQWEDYTCLSLLVAQGTPLDTSYHAYDGRMVTLRGTPGERLLVQNQTRVSVSIVVDHGGRRLSHLVLAGTEVTL